MNPFKKLAGQTAIYGLPTIVARLLNYFLVPLYTYKFAAAEYGVVTDMYAYVSFLMIVATYGMETAVFRFSKLHEDKPLVFTSILTSVTTTSATFILLLSIFSNQIADWLRYPGHSEYVIWFAFIIGLDAISSVCFAKLREQNQAKRFAIIRALAILVNIGFNIFFIAYCKTIYDNETVHSHWINNFYNPEIGVGYIFISNLFASIATLLFLIPTLNIKWRFNKALLLEMLVYALPLLVAGLAGMVNETMDRILLKYLWPDKSTAMTQLGIYGACYKVAILMTIFIQTFRYAAEPFFFSHSTEKDSTKLYADLMKYFVIACSFIFLGTMMYMDIIQYFVGKEYRIGLQIVPILLIANLFLGIFFNLSIWYKLSGQTKYGAYLAIFGAFITILLNILWIPRYGYLGCAWATLVCYVLMAIASYILGNKHYPVNYNIKSIGGYLGLSLFLFGLSQVIYPESLAIRLSVNTFIVFLFVAIVYMIEVPKKRKLI
jgi:O-antigen/teichoic acid export membrane protein